MPARVEREPAPKRVEKRKILGGALVAFALLTTDIPAVALAAAGAGIWLLIGKRRK